jgi:hypothetical protein
LRRAQRIGFGGGSTVAVLACSLTGRTPRPTIAAPISPSLQPDADARDATMYRWTALVQALVASAEFRYLK